MKTKIDDPNHEFLRRPCIKCNEMFRPTTKHNRVCSPCTDKYEEKRWGASIKERRRNRK